MPVESSTLAMPGYPLLSDVHLPERMDTDVEIIRWLADNRRLRFYRIGKQYRFRPDAVEDAVSRRDELLDGLSLATISNPRITAFDRPSLWADEIAEFFGVPEREVRAVLKHLRPRNSINKGDLWRLIVAGAELRAGRLTEIEKRLEAVRRKQRAKIPLETIRLMVQRDLGLCRYCGRIAGDNITTDHVIPKSRGGSDDLANLVVCCTPCNNRKGARLPHEAGLKVLPIGTKGDRPAKTLSSLPPPEESYALLVMGDFCAIDDAM